MPVVPSPHKVLHVPLLKPAVPHEEPFFEGRDPLRPGHQVVAHADQWHDPFRLEDIGRRNLVDLASEVLGCVSEGIEEYPVSLCDRDQLGQCLSIGHRFPPRLEIPRVVVDDRPHATPV